MIGMNFKAARAQFLDSPNVWRKVQHAKLKVLKRQGAFVRTTAKRSIRPARMKKLAEMTPEESARYQSRVDRAKKQGKPKPKRPKASSAPGEPPRSHTKILRKFIFYVYDPRSESVIVGPTKQTAKGRQVPSVLEFGGHGVRARPYMGPALDKERPKFAKMWRNSVK